MEKFIFKDAKLQKEYEEKMAMINRLAEKEIDATSYVWNQTVEKYARKMEKVKNIFNETELGKEYISESMMRRVNVFLEKCSGKEFHVALVGAIKAGKSTLINALLGYSYASTKVTPETASLTKFRKADKNHVKVSFYTKNEWNKLWESANKSKASVFLEEYKNLNADNEKDNWLGKECRTVECDEKEGLVEEIAKWTSSKSPVHYFVKEVEVGLADFRLGDIVLVDTPGLDDVVEYRSNITREYVDRANAVLVCVKSDSLTGQEMATIYSVFANTRFQPEKVYIIATQLDTLNRPIENWKEQCEEWIKYLKRDGAYGSSELARDNLIPVSAYLYTLLQERDNYYQNEKDDRKWDLEALLLKLRVRDFDKEYQNLLDFTKIELLMRKIDREIIQKYREIMVEEIEHQYLECKKEIQGCMERIKKDQEDIVKTSQSGIEEIKKKQAEFERHYKEVQKDKEELQNFVKILQNLTKKRADELENAIKKLGR